MFALPLIPFWVHTFILKFGLLTAYFIPYLPRGGYINILEQHFQPGPEPQLSCTVSQTCA